MRKLYEIFKVLKIQIVSALVFLLSNENLNSFLTRVRKLFKGGNYSREETINGNTTFYIKADLTFITLDYSIICFILYKIVD